MIPRLAISAASALWLSAAGAGALSHGFPPDHLAELQARFDRETNSVQKAKLLVKLGDVQFELTRRAGREGDYQTVGVTLEKYRDNVREALAAVRRNHPKAEKDSAGYRIIEVHVRRGLRELDETILVAPPAYQPPLELVRKDLDQIHDELLRLLFPRRPGEHPASPQKPPKPPKQ